MLILLALQAVASPAAAPPQRFSIMAPPPACRRPGPAANDAAVGDIVICANADTARLPLPEERGPPSRPLPSNMNLDGMTALDSMAPVCAARQAGCQVGVDIMGAGTAAIRLVQKLVAPSSCCEDAGEATDPFRLVGDTIGGIGRIGRKKPDKSGRVTIDLSEPPPPTMAAQRPLP